MNVPWEQHERQASAPSPGRSVPAALFYEVMDRLRAWRSRRLEAPPRPRRRPWWRIGCAVLVLATLAGAETTPPLAPAEPPLPERIVLNEEQRLRVRAIVAEAETLAAQGALLQMQRQAKQGEYQATLAAVLRAADLPVERYRFTDGAFELIPTTTTTTTSTTTTTTTTEP